jgi:serine/threonine protein kinase
MNEMKIMRDLKGHPNIVNLHEVFEGEYTFYFIMELIEGNSL